MKKCILVLIVLASCNSKAKTDTEIDELLAKVDHQMKDSTPVSETVSSASTVYNTCSVINHALAEIKKELKVKDATITEAGVLYVSVYDDGTSRNGYAEYLCQVLKDNNSSVSMVKVVRFGSTKDDNRDNAYGVLLGESSCK